MLRLLKHAHQLEVGVKGHEHHYQDEEDKPPKGKSVVDISKIMDTVVTKLAPPVDKAMASLCCAKQHLRYSHILLLGYLSFMPLRLKL